MSKWKTFYFWSYRALLVVLFVGNLFLKDWVTALMVLALAGGHFVSQLDPKRSRREKIAQIVLMFAVVVIGAAYFYLRYKGR
jgi:hypothetical protein